MTTALVRWCDTPAEVMKRWLAIMKMVELGVRTPPRQWFRLEDNLPILFSDGIHVDDDALEAMFEGRWYYDQLRRQMRRIPNGGKVFINGPHLITKPLPYSWRSRIYTDRSAPFVFPAFFGGSDASDHRPERERRLPQRNAAPEAIGPAGGDEERSSDPDG
jgi:hypothetical protein